MKEKNMQEVVKYLNHSLAYLKQNKKEYADMTLNYAIIEKQNYSTQNELNRFKECLRNYITAIFQNNDLNNQEFAQKLQRKCLVTILKKPEYKSKNKPYNLKKSAEKTELYISQKNNSISKLREYTKEQKKLIYDFKTSINKTHKSVQEMSPFRTIHFSYTLDKIQEIMKSNLPNIEKAKNIRYLGGLAKKILENSSENGTGAETLRITQYHIQKLKGQNKLKKQIDNLEHLLPEHKQKKSSPNKNTTKLKKYFPEQKISEPIKSKREYLHVVTPEEIGMQEIPELIPYEIQELKTNSISKKIKNNATAYLKFHTQKLPLLKRNIKIFVPTKNFQIEPKYLTPKTYARY
ncbi:MAG: hypothetical protein ABFQ65_04290 [Nanoarchaeota archaeon]